MMRQLVLLASVSLALTACMPFQLGSIPIPTSPAAVADRTVIDEQAVLGARTLYEAWLTLVEIGVDGKAIHGAGATCVLSIDDKVHAAYSTAVAAYRVSNATGFFSAKKDLERLVADGTDAIRGKLSC